MRRKDREVTEKSKIDDILRRCHCCRVGFCDEGEVYIVPLNFGLVEENGRRIFYFHSAKEGRKIGLIENSPRVGFELDTGYELKTGERGCDCTARFQSILGTGRVSIVEDGDEKVKGLRALMAQATGKNEWEFDEAMLQAVCVWKLEVEELSCKEHL